VALRYKVLDSTESSHPERLPDDVMAALWSLSAGMTLQDLVWDTPGVPLHGHGHIRSRLYGLLNPRPTTDAHAVYLAWPLLEYEAEWP
jgi:hypothetical protein